MIRVLTLSLILAIAAVAWFGLSQHRREVARQADAAASAAAANQALDAARARLKLAPAPRFAPVTDSTWSQPPARPPASGASSPLALASADFRYDGRTHCSQMHSCPEAQYFLAHCPGVKMDGNHDGEPCEQQFPECGS